MTCEVAPPQYPPEFATHLLWHAVASGLPEDKLFALQVANATGEVGLGRQVLEAFMQQFENYPPSSYSVFGQRPFNPYPASNTPEAWLGAPGEEFGWIDATRTERHEAVAAALGSFAGVIIVKPNSFDEYLAVARQFDLNEEQTRATALYGLRNAANCLIADREVPGTIYHQYGVEVLKTDETNLRRIHALEQVAA